MEPQTLSKQVEKQLIQFETLCMWKKCLLVQHCLLYSGAVQVIAAKTLLMPDLCYMEHLLSLKKHRH